MAFPLLKSFNQPDFSAMCDAAFFEAIKRIDLESCESFIDSRPADYLERLTDAKGNNALHIAVQKWEGVGINDISLQLELIHLLLSHHVDPSKQNAHGVSALDLAKKAQPEIAALFSVDVQSSPMVDAPSFPEASLPPPVPASNPILSPTPISTSISNPISNPILSPTPISTSTSTPVPVLTPIPIPLPTTNPIPVMTPTSPVAASAGTSSVSVSPKPSRDSLGELTEEENSQESLTPSTTVETFLKSNGMQEYEEQFKDKVNISR